MAHITADSLMTLEAYAKARKEFRTEVMAHKKNRTIHLGKHVTLLFEDELTVRYQVQEMLRIERIFEEEGIKAELAAYNPLIPDGANWKVTMLIEYVDADLRKQMLSKLIGIEDRVWVRAAGFSKVYAIADEDLARERADKTSSVHFLRFELARDMLDALKRGVALSMGVDHPQYEVAVAEIDAQSREALIADLK
jgi:Protein of unknown function (DUF3501)